MTNEHTPWVAVGNEVHDRVTKFDTNGARVGETANRIARVECGDADALAERIVAAVNACAGIDPAAVPGLVAALEEIRDFPDHGHTPPSMQRLARAALAKARQG